MNLVPEHIDEAIKHMPGRSEEEIWAFYNKDSWQYKNEDEHRIYDVYLKIIKERPYIKTILENIFGTSPSNYRIQQINKDSYHGINIRFSFYFERYASFTTYFIEPEKTELLIKHRVSIQAPGNSDYSFSISMSDEKVPQAPVDNEPKEYDPRKKPSKKMNI